MFIVFQQLQPNVSAVFFLFIAIICSRYFNSSSQCWNCCPFFDVALLYVHGVSTATTYCCSSSSGIVAILDFWCFSAFILMLQRAGGRGKGSCGGDLAVGERDGGQQG
jgi:hypothetical protein